MTDGLRRKLCIALVSAGIGGAVPASDPAAAENYPSRAITIVVPYQAGGTSDIVARAVAVKLTQALGQPVVVENRSGANGNVGADYVAKSRPDGYMIAILPASTLSINRWIYAAMPFDPEKDLAPITLAVTVPNILVVPPTLPARNVAELIALARAKPNQLNFASQGTGSTGHLNGELFKTLTGVQITHVPYKGSAPAMNDLLAGQVEMMFDNLPTSLPQVKAGRLRALGVTSATRHWSSPDVPAIAETVPGFDATGWFGFVAPAGTPRTLIDRLAREIAKGLQDPEVAPRLRELGLDIVPGSPDGFAAMIHRESLKWRRVVEQSGAKLD